jgi:predicted nucleic acid-binding protein
VSVAYLDSSAIIKLIIREAESAALVEALGEFEAHLTSDVALVEVPRAVRRGGLDDGGVTSQVLNRFATVTLDRQVVELTAKLEPGSLRSLDAIHVASALSLGLSDLVFVAYDRKCLDGARQAHMRTSSPR